MSRTQKKTLLGIGLVLVALVLLAISRYDWNMSALLHMSRDFGQTYDAPKGTVLYEDGGYDGMLYYQIARDIPEILFGNTQTSQRDVSTAPLYGNVYRAQRILLPLFAFTLSFGKDVLLPYALLLINIASVIGALALAFAYQRKVSIGALAIALNPAALVGILFSLTEPLSLFFITLFLFLWKRAGERITFWSAVTLALAMLARETTVFLILPLAVFSLLKKEWKNTFFCLLSLIPFALWTLFLVDRFGALPLETSAGMLNIPFSGPLDLLQRSLAENITAYRLSSLSFLVLFFLPLALIEVYRWWKGREGGMLGSLLLVLIVAMLCLDAHIWGVITSIGRAVTPLYPVFAFKAMEEGGRMERTLSGSLILVSIVAAVGIALVTHPFTLA